MSEDEKKVLDQNEALDFIFKVTNEVHVKICEELEQIHENQRWEIYSRIVNLLFGKHYLISMDFGEKMVAEEGVRESEKEKK